MLIQWEKEEEEEKKKRDRRRQLGHAKVRERERERERESERESTIIKYMNSNTSYEDIVTSPEVFCTVQFDQTEKNPHLRRCPLS